MRALSWTVVCGAVATGCVVSFEDYPVADPDASAAGGSSGVGASGGAWADASTGGSGGISGTGASGAGGASGTAGSGASGGAAGTGGSGGIAGAGGAGGGSGGAAGIGGVSGIGGVGGDACVPAVCDGLACGSLDDNCGGTMNCTCSGPAGCDNGTCKSVVATYCGYCQGAFTEAHAELIQDPGCGTCGTASNLRVCALPGWAMKIAVVTNSACPPGYHLAVGMGVNPDCDGKNRQICIQD